MLSEACTGLQLGRPTERVDRASIMRRDTLKKELHATQHRHLLEDIRFMSDQIMYGTLSEAKRNNNTGDRTPVAANFICAAR